MSQKWCCVGIDIGGTKIAAGLIEFPSGVILTKTIIPTLPQRGSIAVLDDCLCLAQQLADEAKRRGYPLLGIGVGVPELVDLYGNVTSHYTLNWIDVPVQSLFDRIAPAVVESDVRAGALGEAMFGAGRSVHIFVYLTIGTGISHALVIDGNPYAGARGNALICASSPLTTTCDYCGKQLEPILDYIAAGPALIQRYNRLGSKQLRDAKELFTLAENGDKQAQEILQAAGKAVGTTLGFLINVLDPAIAIVGGSVGLAGGVYWDNLVSSTRQHIWAGNARDLPILPAALGVNAGLIGAAATAAKRFAPSL